MGDFWGYQPGQSRDQLPASPRDPNAPPPSEPFPLWLGFALGPALAVIFLLLILFT